MKDKENGKRKDNEECKDCINNTIYGCALNRQPENCNTSMPLPLMMEIGLM